MPQATRQDAVAVVRALRDAGHVAYLAGGCVRDELLGRTPKDYDVATDAPPDRVRALFRNTQAVGAAFGVILVRQGRSVVEVATFRTEGRYEDGRRPSEVHFTTAEQDAKRRDFTINGLYLDPIENRVIDYVGGQDDLRAKRLRAIGDANHRFEEDHLRLLRAIRFASRFELTIEPATSDAIRAHADRLKRISPERIAEELRLMLAPPVFRARAWRMLWEYRLIDVLFRFLPGVAKLGALDPSRSIFLALSVDEAISFGLALAAGGLCFRWHASGHGCDIRPLLVKKSVRELSHAMRQALRISNEESGELEGALLGLGPVLADEPPTLAMKKRLLAQPTASSSRALMSALFKSNLHRDRIAVLTPEFDALSQTDFAPTPLITGDDLTAAGFAPGPVFKKVLDQVYDAQLEDRVRTKSEAMHLATTLARHVK